MLTYDNCKKFYPYKNWIENKNEQCKQEIIWQQNLQPGGEQKLRREAPTAKIFAVPTIKIIMWMTVYEKK